MQFAHAPLLRGAYSKPSPLCIFSLRVPWINEVFSCSEEVGGPVEQQLIAKPYASQNRSTKTGKLERFAVLKFLFTSFCG
jgi:hypothetical protein